MCQYIQIEIIQSPKKTILEFSRFTLFCVESFEEMALREAKFTSYSDFIESGIDPTDETQAAQLRSGLIYPNNPALIPNNFDSNHYFQCYLCQEKYTNEYSLNKHFKIRHLINNINIKQIIIPKWYCCKCKKEFSYKLDQKNQNNKNKNKNKSKNKNKNNEQIIKHICLNSKEKIDHINNNNNLIKLCSIKCNKKNEALSIKRIRYECRIENDLFSVEQWLKYELIRKELTRDDYINAAKMFIAVQGYKIAIQLLEKSQTIFTVNVEEQTLIDVAKRLKEQQNK